MSAIFTSFNIIYFLVFCLLLTAPLPYGSVTPGGKLMLQLQSFIILFVYLIHLYRKNVLIGSIIKQKLQFYALFGFLIICLFQIVPIPGFLLSLVSGTTYEIWAESQNLLNNLGLSEPRYFYTISLNPHKTWTSLIQILSYVSVAFVISRTFTTRNRLFLLLIPIFLLALCEASYGLYQYLSDIEVTDLFYKNIATGTFVNRNNFAGLMEMTIPLILAYTLSLFTWNSNRSFIKNIVSSDNFSKQVLLLFILGLMFLALVLSLSRMGIIVAFLSLIFFWLMHSNITKQTKTSAWIVIFIIFVVILYGLAIGMYPAFERFLELKENTPDRVIVWKDMLAALWDFPIFGTGLGTFGFIYLLYNESIVSPVEFVYAHNDYLQLFIETGIPASLLLLSALAMFLKSTYSKLKELYLIGENLRFYLGLGATTGVIAILLHSLTDFNLHIPSNALYFAVLLGIMAAVGNIEEENLGKAQESFDNTLQTNLTKRRKRKKLSAKSTLED